MFYFNYKYAEGINIIVNHTKIRKLLLFIFYFFENSKKKNILRQTTGLSSSIKVKSTVEDEQHILLLKIIQI